MEVINNFFKKEPNLSFVTAKIQQNCTDTGNDNSEATRQRINCGLDRVRPSKTKKLKTKNHENLRLQKFNDMITQVLK